MDTAKVFWSGRSQAVRLPKEYRFKATEVSIRRQGNAVVLEPVEDGWAWLRKLSGHVDEDFERAVLDRPRDPPKSPPEIDEFFK